MTKVLFINDSAGQRNWGDRAAAVSLRAMIGSLGGDIVAAITEAELHSSSFLGLPSDPEAAAPGGLKESLRPFIPPIVLQWRAGLVAGRASSRKEAVIPATWDGFAASARMVLGSANPWPELPRAIEACDLAVIHGDGAMVGNGLHPRALLFLAYLIKKHFGKPVIMVNHTADFDHPVLLEMARNVYPLFDDVVFRDTVSAERWSPLAGGRFAADTAFWFSPCPREEWARVAGRPTFFDVWPDVARFDPSRPYLCIGGSSIYGVRPDLPAIVRQWTRALDQLSTFYPGQIILTAADVVDAQVFRPVSSQLGLPLLGLHTPTQQAVDVIGNADAYIGGRWHPAIFALRGGAPLISLAGKTFKMRALSEMAGLSGKSFDACEVEESLPGIGEQLLSLLEPGEDLRRRLRSWGDAMSENAWDNLRWLAGAAGARR